MKKPTVLMILDGYGLNERKDGNAVAKAKTPVMDKLMAECPFVKGNASGMAVGLPDGQMGNSEVGHLNMGAGRIVYQELTRITREIQDGTFFENPALLMAVENCKKNDSALHMFGLLSDGGVHSHNTHLYGLLELAKRNGLSKVYVHCFLDGRDTPPASGKGYAEDLEAEMKKIGAGEIASVMGRYYAMDRDNNYDRVKLAYDALTKGEGLTAASGPEGRAGAQHGRMPAEEARRADEARSGAKRSGGAPGPRERTAPTAGLPPKGGHRKYFPGHAEVLF